MTNPYDVLGISKDATEEEINIAYRKLVKQYHPDKYVGNPLSDLAAEKIKEINEAYDAVMDNLKNKNSSQQDSSYYQQSQNSSGTGSEYNEIRNLINEGRLDEAQMRLNNMRVRDAEWHFLAGMLLKNKGWYDMAYQHLNRAASLDPTNEEYRTARDNMDFSGYQYRSVGGNGNQADCCNMCQGLMCADCCCEMCGGNILPCIGCR
ncbi:MAG: DnaJ domain-containing protein [Clostridia bacterium]|nr:DnaJ domain-containing protein [Clostridia bacterium]